MAGRPKKILPPDPDEFDGDPCEGICALLLLLGNGKGRIDAFARDAISAEVERFLEPTFSANRDMVAMEKHQRLQALYADNLINNKGNGNAQKSVSNYEF
jgi:hypothetical protein